MKWALFTIGFIGVCLGKPNPISEPDPNNIEVMQSSGGLPPIQSGIPVGNNVQPMVTNAGGLTRPSWPGSYQPSPPIYSNPYPRSGQTYSRYPSTSSGGCSSGGCSSGSSSYPSSGGCSSGGCSSGSSSYPAPQPVYGGSGFNPGWTGGSGYNPGWTGGSGYNPGVSGGSGYNPGVSGGSGYNPGVSGGSGFNPGMSAPVYKPCSSSGRGGCGSSGSSFGGCGSSRPSYGTMVGSLMPSCSGGGRRVGGWGGRAGRFGGWRSSMPTYTVQRPAISSGVPSASSGSGCGSCGK